MADALVWLRSQFSRQTLPLLLLKPVTDNQRSEKKHRFQVPTFFCNLRGKKSKTRKPTNWWSCVKLYNTHPKSTDSQIPPNHYVQGLWMIVNSEGGWTHHALHGGRHCGFKIWGSKQLWGPPLYILEERPLAP